MIIGIDLGTTNSLVGVFKDGQPRLIRNALGDFATPSAVSIDEQGHLLVGNAARERASTHPESTTQAFKRWMGTDHRVRLGARSFRPEELSALVLQQLKADAEAFLGETVTEAVITVPAYFNEAQRRATRAAGEIAGLKVERLLNEPTAAGLAYGLQERADHTAFLVFDLGGGTFDVSVLEYFEGVVEVRASAGDTQLGGEDFVRVLARLFVERCPDLPTASREAMLAGDLGWRAAEQAKRDLSEKETATLSLVVGDRTFAADISRADFESASETLVQRLRRPIERALNDARIDASALSEVVLVGGASRMPMIRHLTTRLFQRLPLRTIDPDLAIAQGAAIQAGLKARDAALDEVVLTDVMPYSLGVTISQRAGNRLVDDRFSPIIERNTPVPVSRMQSYSTLQDNQSVIRLDIRQGESPVSSENLLLGVLDVEVPAGPAGTVGVDVRFTYDANGLLEVDARETSTGNTTTTLVRNQTLQMTDDELAAALSRLRTLKRHPRDQEENRYLLARAKRLYEERLGDERTTILAWMTQFESALDTQDERTIRPSRQGFREALDSVDHGFRF